MNTIKGLAAAFSIKTITTAVISLGVAAVVAVGGYSVASNYVLFPDFDEALTNTLEAKSEPLTEFDTKKFEKEGKTEISLDIPDLDLDATLSLSHSEKALQAALKTCGETFTLSYKDLNVAASIDGFNKGEAYGLSIKNLRDQIMDSIFAADSGTDYEIPMDTINQICDFVETITEPKEVSEEYERAYEFLIKVFEKSEMAKDAKISYSKLEVLGKERSGRSQTLTINVDYIVDLLEDYADAFEDAKGKDLDAIEFVLEDLDEKADLDMDIDDIVDALEEAADSIEDVEGIDDLEIKYSVLYVGKYLSAVVASVEYKNKDVDADVKGTVTVDFGAKPNKTYKTIFNVSLEGEVEDEKADIEAEVVFDAKKEGGKVTYSVEASFEANIPGEEPLEGSALAKIVLNASKKKGEVSVSAEYLDEQYDFFSAEFKLIDTKDQFSITPKSIIVMDEEFEIPFDITVSLYRKPDKIKANKYVDVLDMDEDEFEDFVDELEEYFEELAKDLAEDFGDISNDVQDALDGVEDIFGDMGGVEDFPMVDDNYWSDDWDDWDDEDYIYPEISYEF